MRVYDMNGKIINIGKTVVYHNYGESKFTCIVKELLPNNRIKVECNQRDLILDAAFTSKC